MPIYKQNGNKLTAIKGKKIELEKNIQTLVENNLENIFGLQFVCTEFTVKDLRIDTLAFDPESKSFVIIEYKRGSNNSVIDQGYTYLSLLLHNKADFVLGYNERCKKNLRKDDIDWSQSKIIFVAQSFTKYQQQAIGFQDLPIELWEFKKYDENIILLNLSPNIRTAGIHHFIDATQILRDSDRFHFSDSDDFKTFSVTNQIIDTHLEEVADALAEVVKRKNNPRSPPTRG